MLHNDICPSVLFWCVKLVCFSLVEKKRRSDSLDIFDMKTALYDDTKGNDKSTNEFQYIPSL